MQVMHGVVQKIGLEIHGEQMNTGNSKIMHHHSHIHGVVTLVNFDTQKAIEQDAKFARLPDTSRQDFALRTHAVSSGGRKNRPGRSPEHVEARIEDYNRTEQKAKLANAAADAGVIVETTPAPVEDLGSILEGSTEALDA